MPNNVPDWLETAGYLVAGGGTLAVLSRRVLAYLLTTKVDIKTATANDAVLSQMLDNMQRMGTEHITMAEALNTANALLINIQRRMVVMDGMLVKMHALLVQHDIDVPRDVQEHLMREVI